MCVLQNSPTLWKRDGSWMKKNYRKHLSEQATFETDHHKLKSSITKKVKPIQILIE